MQSTTDWIEASGLKIVVIVNFIMAFAGWLAYSISNSEALLLDGYFSFISMLTTIGAIIIIKKNKSINYLSPILSVEAKSSKIDGYLRSIFYLIQFDPTVMFHAHISGPLAISTPA